MSAIRRRGRAFLGLPSLDDPNAVQRPRTVPWLAAPVVFVLALPVLVAIGVAVEKALGGRNNWQVNAPAIAGLTVILLLAPSSSTQPRARNAFVAAVVGLAVVAVGYGVAVAGHDPATTYGATAFLLATAGALAGCVGFTAITHVDGWTTATRGGASAGATKKADGGARDDTTDADATGTAEVPRPPPAAGLS
jgi:hypothetical protein